MSDRPWLEDGDPSLRVERSLLKRLNAQQPPSGSADHGWAALAADIAGLQALGTGANLAEQAHAAAHATKGGFGLLTAAKVAASVAVAVARSGVAVCCFEPTRCKRPSRRTFRLKRRQSACAQLQKSWRAKPSPSSR